MLTKQQSIRFDVEPNYDSDSGIINGIIVFTLGYVSISNVASFKNFSGSVILLEVVLSEC